MDLSKESGSFTIAPGFCPDCGTILPLCDRIAHVICRACKRNWRAKEVFGEMKISYTVEFRNRDICTVSKPGEDDDEEEPEGPVVERQCRQCKHNQMSYATLQMRSADEGQTVFYTCTKCKFKETENS